MKGLLKLISLGAVVAAAASPAFADANNQISFAGADTYCSPTGGSGCTAGAVTFTYDYPVAPGAATGIFSAFSGSTATFNNFNYLTTSTPFTLLTDTYNGETLTFTVTGLSYTYTAAGLDVTGNGYYTVTIGGKQTVIPGGTFDLTTQGATNSIVTFSDTNSITPEPSSLLLLGTGLVGAAAMMVRRRKTLVEA